MKKIENENVEFGRRLRILRERRALSVSELAQSVGVAQSTYREWEQGRAITGYPYIRLSEALKTSVSSLFGIEQANTTAGLRKISEIEALLGELRKHLNS